MTPLLLGHVLVSLIAIVFGFVVMAGFAEGKTLPRSIAIFLLTTIATSVTGFFFPFDGFTPGHTFGVVSLIVLAVAVNAYYRVKLAGAWRAVFVVTAMLAQYLNFVVLIIQSFQKIPALNELAPTQSNEPAFLTAQLVSLVVFVAWGVLALKNFRTHTAAAA